MLIIVTKYSEFQLTCRSKRWALASVFSNGETNEEEATVSRPHTECLNEPGFNPQLFGSKVLEFSMSFAETDSSAEQRLLTRPLAWRQLPTRKDMMRRTHYICDWGSRGTMSGPCLPHHTAMSASWEKFLGNQFSIKLCSFWTSGLFFFGRTVTNHDPSLFWLLRNLESNLLLFSSTFMY